VKTNDYYVSSTGSDSNSGTQTNPWRTVAKVNSVAFAAGARVFFQGGQTFAGKLYFDANDKGTATNPITVSSYGTGRAIVTGGTDYAFLAYNTGGITITNIDFQGVSSTAPGIGFYCDLTGGVKLPAIAIDQVNVGGFGQDGISIGSWNGQSVYDGVK